MPLTIARRRTGAGSNLDHNANTTPRLDYLTHSTSRLRECEPKAASNSMLVVHVEQISTRHYDDARICLGRIMGCGLIRGGDMLRPLPILCPRPRTEHETAGHDSSRSSRSSGIVKTQRNLRSGNERVRARMVADK
ncbi:hypothetical protein CFE70_010096 [Pyrenophora teres f. teres 0-1]